MHALNATPQGRARGATTLLFFLTGAVFATWAARIPAIQGRLGLSSGGLAVALVGVEAGALAGLPGGGRLVTRLGSATTLRLGFALYPPALVTVALAPTLTSLVAALTAIGASNSVIDVAMNAQGIELERRHRRPLLSGLHSGHSFGVLAGGLSGTILAARSVDVLVHFTAVAVLAVAAAQIAAGALLNEAREPASTSRGRGPGRALALIGLLAFCAFFVEGAANDWSAVHARSVHGASPAFAAATFTAFSLTLALGRLTGDRVVARWGRVRSIRAAALVAAAGAVVVVAAPTAVAALAGWAVLGAGVAAIAPTLLGAAPAASAAPPAVAIATVSMIGYAGSFAGPPLIGGCAELTSLPAALGSLVLGSAAIAALAGRALAPDRRLARPDCTHIAAVLRSPQRTTCPVGGERPANQPFLQPGSFSLDANTQ
jgi:MFS family permease